MTLAATTLPSAPGPGPRGARPDDDAAPPAPKVSVVIPAYDREKYIVAAIDSILAQSFADFELVVVDDGSTDGTREVVRGYADPRIRLICHARNLGVAAARNEGVRQARGEYLAFLDSDDIAFPDRLARQVAFLDSHGDVAALGAWVDWMDDGGRPLERIKRKAISPEDIAAQRLFRAGIQNTASMARTEIMRRFLHDERYSIGEDFHLWARIAAEHKLANLPRVLVRCRAHAQRTTHDKIEQIREQRLTIYQAQLDALGIAYTQEDLKRHYLLRRMHKMDFRPDPAYLDWAERWLCALRDANRRAKLYPEPAFSHVLGGFWAKACGHAHRQSRWRALTRFLRSPLRPWAWAGIWKDLVLIAPRPFARRTWRPAP